MYFIAKFDFVALYIIEVFYACFPCTCTYVCPAI